MTALRRASCIIYGDGCKKKIKKMRSPCSILRISRWHAKHYRKRGPFRVLLGPGHTGGTTGKPGLEVLRQESAGLGASYLAWASWQPFLWGAAPHHQCNAAGYAKGDSGRPGSCAECGNLGWETREGTAVSQHLRQNEHNGVHKALSSVLGS